MQEFAHETQSEQASRRPTRRRAVVSRSLSLGLAFVATMIGSPLMAQPPRIVAPEDVVLESGGESGNEDGLPIRGFMFLDEAR